MSQLPSLNEAEAAFLRIIVEKGGEISEDDYMERVGIASRNAMYRVAIDLWSPRGFIRQCTVETNDNLRSKAGFRITDAGRSALAEWEEKQKK